MLDIAYILGTLLFFGAMLLYVAGCDRLGRHAAVESGEEERQ